jgi:replicative DNA helicase
MIKDFENKMLKCIFNKPNILIKNIEYISRDELFVEKYNKYILQHIIEYYTKYNEVPSIDFVCDMIINEGLSSHITKICIDHITLVIEPIELTEGEMSYLEDNIKKRLKDNIVSKTANRIEKLTSAELEKNISDVYNLQQENPNYETIHLWEELEEEKRQPIPTGLELIDEYGIAKGELGLLLAGTGVGKSVFLTYLANNFMLGGYKTLHIVFEGHKNTYLRAHRTKLGNPTTEKLRIGKTIPNLRIVQMKSNNTTTKDIESLLNNTIQDGFIPDVIVLDYVDCLVGSTTKEIWQQDIKIVNELEHISQKYNIALWSAVQANRSGINKELSLENIAGSITKAQKASFILALTRSPEQEELNRATMSVLKNRFGDKRTSYDCVWNPAEMKIELPIKEKTTL